MGGIDRSGKWQKHISTNKFLFPVKALSKVFRAKYVYYLRENAVSDHSLLNSLFHKEWVVYAKRPFGGPQQVIEYLGRYTHKVAISNHRMQEVTAAQVSFSYKDYRDGGRNKTMQLSKLEFTRRFAKHILPLRFVRIRHYGILSSTWKRGKLQALQQHLKMPVKPQVIKTLSDKCPCCKTGMLITIEVFGKRGQPAIYLMDALNRTYHAS